MRSQSRTFVRPAEQSADISLPSLFVVGLPRSLATLVFHVARLALRLKEPTWTTDGEVMNVDRFVMTPAVFDHAGIKYLRSSRRPGAVRQASRIPDPLHNTSGIHLQGRGPSVCRIRIPGSMSCQFADKRDVCTVMKEVRTERMPKQMRREWLVNLRFAPQFDEYLEMS
jgi:hypothetical protein